MYVTKYMQMGLSDTAVHTNCVAHTGGETLPGSFHSPKHFLSKSLHLVVHLMHYMITISVLLTSRECSGGEYVTWCF